MTLVRLEPTGLRSRVKHSTTEPLHSRSGSMVECLSQDRGVAGSSLTGGIVLCPRERYINTCLVLVQPRKIHPDITEKLLTGT